MLWCESDAYSFRFSASAFRGLGPFVCVCIDEFDGPGKCDTVGVVFFEKTFWYLKKLRFVHGNGPFCAETARFFTIKNLTMKLKLLLAALILPFIALAQQPDTVGAARNPVMHSQHEQAALGVQRLPLIGPGLQHRARR